MRRGAFHYITKPFAMEALRSLVESACRERTLSTENAQLRRTLRENASARQLLGGSTAMRSLRALIERVAGAASSVLISGETGTGKELVALSIHADSPRADRPFVAVNCAALPEALLESELFGHARGAFTGAMQARRGLFVEADEGTLFLDEIGDMPLPLQGKLLRVLQSGEVRPVGSETSRRVDVRCVAATHRDLAGLVEKGLFREDLFFRLDVLRVPIPALRDRSEDIPMLVEHFLRKSLSGASRSVLAGFEPEALDFLATCDWPGNVRQLENLIERLVVTASTPLARLADVRQALGPVRDVDPIAPLLQKPLRLDELEARYIAAILQRVGGSKLKAAEILGVDPSTLYRRERPRG
jgi:two-component system response regulator HydG